MTNEGPRQRYTKDWGPEPNAVGRRGLRRLCRGGEQDLKGRTNTAKQKGSSSLEKAHRAKTRQ